ncbi:two-component regulator propeller domain-containing protein [Paucibacter soli]|uniref:two-component regulator propeller domain-containing protein n=1 Tax=Paucibacter soli TaxID=3133433 RepID=UPI0030ACD40B
MARLSSCLHALTRLLALLAGLLLAPAVAEAQSAAMQTLRFQHLRGEQGLPDDSVTALLQDPRGFMWLGTVAGLARYDGRRMKLFGSEPEQAASLSHAFVQALLADGAGGMWVGTARGLDHLDWGSERIRRHELPAWMSAQQRRVFALAPNGSGRLWLATAGGLLRYELSSGRAERVGGDASATARALLPDGSGGVWVGQGAQVRHLDAEGRELLSLDAAAASGDAVRGTVRSLLLDHRQRLWVGTHAGAQIWELGGNAPRLHADTALLPKLGVVYALRQDGEKTVWLGSSTGLLRLRDAAPPAEWFRHHPALPNSLGGDAVAALFQDEAGTLWVGTWGDGVSLVDLQSQGFTSYRHLPDVADSLAQPGVMAIVPDGRAHAWVGTYGAGLNRLHLPSGHAERIAPSATGVARIKALLPEGAERLWIGGEEGLTRYDTRLQRHQRIALDHRTPGGASISSLLRDRQGEVWAGSAAGLYRIDATGRLRSYRATGSPGALAHDTVDCLLEDREGRLWIGTKGGLHRWRPESESFEQPLRPSAGIANPARLNIQALRQDSRGRIWVGTDLGLYELLEDGSGWTLASWRHTLGMPPGWINAIQDAVDGELWMSGQRGLVRLRPEQHMARLYPSHGGPFDGVFSFGAAARSEDGSLFFGAAALYVFKPELLRDNLAPPRVVLSDLLVFNRSLLASDTQAAAAPAESGSGSTPPSLQQLGIAGPLHEARTLRLSHREAMVSLEFAALSYYDHALNQYAWMLEGFDKEWIYGKPGEGVATYTNLDPGSYRLLVKAAGAGGVWSEGAFGLSVEVLPPWWGSRWFRALALALLLLGLALLHQLRLRSLQRARQLLEQQVQARTQQVVEQQQQLEREKRAVEVQHEAAERARRSITLLSEIGRELTASLDAKDICETLYRHVDKLMDASVFGVGLVDWDERLLRFDFVRQGGRAFKPYKRSLDAQEQHASQCALHARELIVRELGRDVRMLDERVRALGEAQQVELEDGMAPSPARSGLYVPMLLKGQVMGVISVLSSRPDAYRETDLDMLRNLGAYAAVALAKAEAYHHLELTREKLVEQEKLAALGALVAGVAHELNTPIGNALMMASTLRDSSRRFKQRLGDGGLRRSELDGYCEGINASAELLMKSLEGAATLVQSFKQLALDQRSDQRRSFDLQLVCTEVALTLQNFLRHDQHELQLDVPGGILLDSYPGPLGQVLSNLIVNAVLHGFEGRKGGHIRLAAELQGREQVLLSCSDNGRGIAPAHLKRIFEPFFTTRLGQGGSGLGLHISYNIVNSLLGGSITASTAPGAGACFELLLPLKAPQAQSFEI